MTHLRLVPIVLSALLLAGCNTIEHRSETIEKKPLPPIKQAAFKPTKVWEGSAGRGSLKADVKLELALSESHVVTADSRGGIEAKDSKTFKTLWRVKAPNVITGGPSLYEHKILVGTKEGKVLCYRLQDGELLWKADVISEVLAAPKAKDNIAFVHTLDGSVCALNMQDGKMMWRYHLDIPPIVLRRGSAPALTQGQVLVGFSNGKMVSLNRMDGAPEWEKEIAIPKGRSDIQRMNDICADPVVMDNVVYVVSYQGKLAALSLTDGQLIWETPMSSTAGFAVGKNALYIAEANGVFKAVDRAHGTLIWKQEGLMGRSLSTPLFQGDRVVFGDDDGYLHWLNANNGEIMARLKVDSKGIESAPIMGRDGKLYVLSHGGKLAVVAGPRAGQSPGPRAGQANP